MSLINISFAVGDGMAQATSSLVGQNLGRDRPDLSTAYGHLAQRVGLSLGMLVVAFFILFRRYLIMPCLLYTSPPAGPPSFETRIPPA